MRFLQLEWHNHERARNSWDIERAEMRAKIAKLEGENRHSKRINEQLDKQVRMLEMAVKRERDKSKAANGNGRVGTPEPKAAEKEVNGKVEAKEGETDGKRMDKNNALEEKEGLTGDAAPNKPQNSFLEMQGQQDTSEQEREQYLDNTTKYLKNCMKEIQYLLTPPQYAPPPPQNLPNGNFTGLPEPPLSVEDIYVRNQRRNIQQPGQALPQPPSIPNHSAPPIPNSLPQTSGPQDLSPYPDVPSHSSQPPLDALQQTAQNIPAPFEEPSENIAHSFDARGRVIPDASPVPRSARQTDADGWTFDEETNMLSETAPPDVPPPRRPDTDLFPSAASPSHLSAKSPPRAPGSHRRKSSGSQAMSRRRSSQGKQEAHAAGLEAESDPSQFKVKFALRGHLDVVRSVIFSGGGSPSEPEVCTAGDDGTIKRWIVPAAYQSQHAPSNNLDLDIQAYFTHRGHDGVVTSLATCPASTGFSTGGRANGDGWIFSGGQDATVKVWERGRVDPKATLEGHADAVWAVCILPASVGVVFGPQSSNYGGPDRLLLVSGGADGVIKVWAVSSPPQTSSPSTGSRRGVGGSRRHSVTSGSNFPSSPQPSVASATPFSYTLIHSIERPEIEGVKASPTSICPLSPSGETFVVSYTDSSVIVYDTRTGEELIGMASNETYDGTLNTSISSVVATSLGLEGAGGGDAGRGMEAEEVGAGATGSREGVEGVVISGHEDRFVRFFDANSGMSPNAPYQTPKEITKTNNANSRPMHLHHARAPLRHLRLVPVQRRPGSRVRGSRREYPLLVAGEAHLHAGYCVASRHAWGGRL